jgi:hypothetical protein
MFTQLCKNNLFINIWQRPKKNLFGFYLFYARTAASSPSSSTVKSFNDLAVAQSLRIRPPQEPPPGLDRNGNSTTPTKR